MYANDRLWAPSRGSYLIYQIDGNLVLYTSDGTALWSTRTHGTSPGHTEMQADGNLVIYSADRTALWSTGTHGNAGAYLELGDDANLAVRSADGSSTLWSR